MKLTYKKMKEFMLNYCKDYSRYANDAESMYKMDKYWAPDFKVTAYFHRTDGTYPVVYTSRKDFQEFLIRTHTVIKDTMKVRDVIIDDKINKAVILLKIEKRNQKTGEAFEIDGMGCYQLILDEKKAIKIVTLDFFWDAPEKIKNLGSKR